MSDIAVRTSELGKRYRDGWALRDCTLEIPAGSVSALVGPNGAGKTTLLHLVIGLSRQTSGTVEVLGLSPGRTRRPCCRDWASSPRIIRSTGR